MTLWRAAQQFWLVAVLLCAAVLLRIWDPEPIARLRLVVFDTYLRMAPRAADPAMPVKIVDLDTASLERTGQWPWPRTRVAEMISALREAGAKSISLDIILAEPDRLSPKALADLFRRHDSGDVLVDAAGRLPSNDAVLAKEIADGKVVLGFVAQDIAGRTVGKAKAGFAMAGDDPSLFLPRFSGAVGSLAALEKGAAGLGSVNWVPSADLVVRRIPLLMNAGGVIYPSLALEALRVGSGETTIVVKASGGSGIQAFGQQTGIELIKTGSYVLPATSDGELWLKFAPADDKRYIPAHRIVEKTFDRAEVEGKHIFIGASAPGLLDLRATPLHASVPGVEIHAQALEQMLSGDHLVRPAYATGAGLLFIIVAGAGVGFALLLAGPLVAAMAGLVAIAAVFGFSWWSFKGPGLLFDPVYPSLALAAVYLVTSLTKFVTAEVERAYVRRAFSHYVAPQLVEQLAEDASALKLGGETREVTILFSDVRGFSRISEGLDAEELVRFINELFTPVADIILEEQGTIDKFMGDAVMAFWNAPVRDKNHARSACRAALRMLAAVDELNRQKAVKAAVEGKPHVPVRIGVGLNTGDCVVGNVGSPQRFDYSILGDVVNVAARLEESTKAFGAPVIVGEATMAQAQDFAFIEIGKVPLRGKDREERVFALVGDEDVARSDAFSSLKKAQVRLLRALDAGDAREAEKALAEARAVSLPGLSQLFEAYAAKLAAKA